MERVLGGGGSRGDGFLMVIVHVAGLKKSCDDVPRLDHRLFGVSGFHWRLRFTCPVAKVSTHLACQNQRAHGWVVAPRHITAVFIVIWTVSRFTAHLGGNIYIE